ncbi:AbrB family transcriptional regulator [Cobetia sp. 1CM21F]|uniref:AbrB family transcriptional regulator n=1 Tax=Cobetia sp. 1CM21F TaxID=2929163 RepID=UPI0032B7B5CE
MPSVPLLQRLKARASRLSPAHWLTAVMSLRAVMSLKAATSLKADAPLRPLLTSLALGGVGGWLFQLTGMPLAWMLGPLVANLLGAMAGLKLGVPDRMRNLFLGVLGLTLGARVSPELVSHLSSWWLSALLLLAGVWASTLACAAWYRRCGFDATSAWFSSVPGALTAMVVIGERIGGDPQRIAVAQSLRVLLVIMILPPLYWVLEGAAGTPGIGSDVAVSGLWLIAVLPILLPLARRLRIPNASLLAPLLLALVLSLGDVVRFSPPVWGTDVMQLVLGCAIGARFKGLTPRVLVGVMGQSGVATLISLSVLGCFAELIHQLMGVPRDVAFLALAPGGIGEMALLAVALDLDPIFVAFHHLLRLIVLMLLLPVMARHFRHRRAREATQ